jgi:hypothetical protein
VEIKVYMVYCYTIFGAFENMSSASKNEEIRWQVIKAMLDEFPVLKEKVKSYLKEPTRKQ